DDFASKLSGLASKARNLGYDLEEVDLVKRLLDSMPKSFLQTVALIEPCFVLDSMLINEAIGRLKAYEERIKGAEMMEDTQGGLLLAGDRKSHWCKRCGNDGSNQDGFGRDRGRGRGSGKSRDVFGSKMWKASPNTPPLPPIIQKMPGRPRKKRVRHPTENDYKVNKVDVGGSSSKNVGKGTRSNVGRGTGSNVGRGGGSSSKRGGGSVGRDGGLNMGRGDGSVGKGGGSSSKRGGGSVGRGGGSSSKKVVGVLVEVVGQIWEEVDKRQLALDEEAAREWNGDFRNDHDITTPLKFPTRSELEAVDEAHDEYFNNMDSITTGAQTAAQTSIVHVISADNVSNNEQPRIHLTQKFLTLLANLQEWFSTQDQDLKG
nr:zinc finger, CCHC-type [Tanacetum cinerariifolium]